MIVVVVFIANLFVAVDFLIFISFLGQIVNNPKVAVLIHDFPHLDETTSTDTGHGKQWSITLNGVVEALEEGSELAENYRFVSAFYSYLNLNLL